MYGAMSKSMNVRHSDLKLFMETENTSLSTVAKLYDLLLTAALSQTGNPDHGSRGYYFGVHGEHSMYDIGKAISTAMYKKGKGDGKGPTTFTPTDIRNLGTISKHVSLSYSAFQRLEGFSFLQGVYYLGSNTRCKASRSKALQWDPKKTISDMLASVNAELDFILNAVH